MNNSKKTVRKLVAPTQIAVAKEAGVSQETVSHILGKKKAHRYRKETQKRVLAAAKKLGYRYHKGAQSLRGVRSNLIGVIHFGSYYRLTREAVLYLPRIIAEHGYDPFVVDLSWHGGSYQRTLDSLIDMRVEGIIISSQVESFGIKEVQILQQAKVPLVGFTGNEKLGIPVVYGDSRGAFEKLVNHLYTVGHRRLMLLMNNSQGRSAYSRIQGVEAGSKKYPDIEIEIVRLSEGLFTTENYLVTMKHHIKQLLTSRKLPDAILCTNDRWARILYTIAAESGIKVPEDVAITGFDNDEFGEYAPYYLTTAAPNVLDMSHKAVSILFEMLEGQTLNQQQYIYPCEMILRKSCGRYLSNKRKND